MSKKGYTKKQLFKNDFVLIKSQDISTQSYPVHRRDISSGFG
jgi:hypothetical protein